MHNLVARCEAADGPDRMLDAEIARAFGWDQDEDGEWHAVGVFFNDGAMRRTSYAVELPAFTASIDAALTLIQEGWAYHMLYEPSATKGQEAVVCPPGVAMPTSAAKTLPLAICAAALKARAT